MYRYFILQEMKAESKSARLTAAMSRGQSVHTIFRVEKRVEEFKVAKPNVNESKEKVERDSKPVSVCYFFLSWFRHRRCCCLPPSTTAPFLSLFPALREPRPSPRKRRLRAPQRVDAQPMLPKRTNDRGQALERVGRLENGSGGWKLK